MTMKYEGEEENNNDHEENVSNEGSFRSLLTCELTGG